MAVTTKDVAIAYMMQRVRDVGFSPCGYPELQVLAGEMNDSCQLRQVVAKLNSVRAELVSDREYGQIVSQGGDNMSPSISSSEAERFLHMLGDSNFLNGKYNWGRLSMFIVYITDLAIQALRCGCPQRAADIISWLVCYLNNPLATQFLCQSGGWTKVLGMDANQAAAPNVEGLSDMIVRDAITAIGSAVSALAQAYNFFNRCTR